MKAKVIDSGENGVNISFNETDVATLYIIQHELLKNSDVDLAGVIVKHPLTSECWMSVNSKSDPYRNIADATDTAIGVAEEIKAALSTDIRIP